ncbi:hypothetical protein AB0F68_07710 [Micromonospora sp. NPDC023966]|uniref:ATP-binding protein n=1 Tax=Micromonospora sp. NPDC023966 TaxID=3154699 RepID=UPI0033FE835B
MQLFAARAAAADPAFRLTADNVGAVAELCSRLDGLPLALELVAGRIPAMDVRDLVDRLNERHRQRSGPQRQQTLSAVVEWSWELLTASERAVLRRLAPHPGGCTLAAAEAVCGGDDVPVSDVAELLGRLVDRSLVVRLDSTSGSRYRLLETVRTFCVERLAQAGEAEVIHRRYEGYFAGLAGYAEPRLYGHRPLFAYLGELYDERAARPAHGPVSARSLHRAVVSADGTSIAMEAHGDGPAVVLVGGALNDRRTFLPLARGLAAR